PAEGVAVASGETRTARVVLRPRHFNPTFRVRDAAGAPVHASLRMEHGPGPGGGTTSLDLNKNGEDSNPFVPDTNGLHHIVVTGPGTDGRHVRDELDRWLCWPSWSPPDAVIDLTLAHRGPASIVARLVDAAGRPLQGRVRLV